MRRFDRDPQFNPGANVRMEHNRYSLFAETDGIMTVRTSVANDKFRIVDIEPDIAKVKLQRSMRQELESRGRRHYMTSDNQAYADELKDMLEPDWRIATQKVLSDSERFADPNLVGRGLRPSSQPTPKYIARV